MPLALLRPGLAEDLVLTNPAGMHGEDTRSGLIGRTAVGFAEQQVTNVRRARQGKEERNRVFGAVGSALKGTQIQHKPLWRFQKEIPGIIQSNIIPVLQSLKTQQTTPEEHSRTKVTLVTANKDRTFSPKRIEDNLQSSAEDPESAEAFFGDAVDSYVMYVDQDSGHEEIIYGKSGLSAQIVNEKLQQKQDLGKEE